MSTIAVTAFPTRTYNRIVTSFAAEPYLYAKLWRVNELTGVETPVRPAVAYVGDCMLISCNGQQQWWDTEVPFDTPYHYRAESCTPATILDTFTRVVANGWGTPEYGPAYGTSGGAVGDYSTTGSRGQLSLTSVNVRRSATIDLGYSDNAGRIDLRPGVLALTQPIEMGVAVRWLNSTNFYLIECRFQVGGQVLIRLRRNVAGTFTDLATSVNLHAYTTTSITRMAWQIIGNTLYAKAWLDSKPEPDDWQVVWYDNTAALQTPTVIAPTANLATGNTNGLPVNVQFDNLRVDSLDSSLVKAAASTVSSVQAFMPSDGDFWFKDPVRPCRNRRIKVCVDLNPECAPGNGIEIMPWEADRYASLSSLIQPISRTLGRSIARPRAGASNRITLISRSFADRDDVLNLTQPGEPVLWQAPPSYGVADRYLMIDEVSVTPALPDMTYPPRVIQLPYVAGERPSGPMQGACGMKVEDQCYTYQTWDAMEAAGITYLQLFDGTSTGGPGV